VKVYLDTNILVAASIPGPVYAVTGAATLGLAAILLRLVR
jgi:hypothetical protein